MDAGTTLHVPDPGASYDSHLWMILSDPKIDPDHVLIVNFTSCQEWQDQACVLEVGEHPYIQHRTLVNFRGAKMVTLAQLHALKDSGKIKLHEPLSPELLKKIRTAVADSKMKMQYADFLIEQGVIEEC